MNRPDAEGVRRRSRPTTKWSDSKSIHVKMVISSDADSFKIKFLRLSAFQILFVFRISISTRRRNHDFEQTTSSSGAFIVGPHRGRTASRSDASGGNLPNSSSVTSSLTVGLSLVTSMTRNLDLSATFGCNKYAPYSLFLYLIQATPKNKT